MRNALLGLLVVVGCDGLVGSGSESSGGEQNLKPGGGGGTPTYVPMSFNGSVVSSGAPGLPQKVGCIMNDVDYEFGASGSLNPGESFTFITMPVCAGWGEGPFVSAQLNWDASQIEMTSQIPSPGERGTGWNDVGLTMRGQPVGNESHLCMWIAPGDDPADPNDFQASNYLNVVDTGTPWSSVSTCTTCDANGVCGPCPLYGDVMGIGVKVTLRNVGTTTAYKVNLSGHIHGNGWPMNWIQWSPWATWKGADWTCARADGDGDGWNDALEASMFSASYGLLYSSHLIPFGPSTARALPGPVDPVFGTPETAYPPDFNNDGVVDQADLALLNSFVGQGTGIPWGFLQYYDETGQPYPRLPPNVNLSANADSPWVRFDLNGDGFVDQKDVALEQLVIGQPYPMTQDILPPSARFFDPWNGGTLVAGQLNWVTIIATDNKWLAKVELYMDGKLVGSSTTPAIPYGTIGVTPRRGTHTLMAKAYDGAGNTGTDTITVTAQ